MIMRYIKSLLLFCICCKLCCLTDSEHINIIKRSKRGFFWDAVQKMAITKNLVVDQFVDTKNTFNEVYNMLNEGFSDPAPRKPTLAHSSISDAKPGSSDGDDDEKTSSTTERYHISRYEFGRILGRNFRGLKRLANIEFSDALNATKYNLQEYKAEADRQYRNSLALQKKNTIKSVIG